MRVVQWVRDRIAARRQYRAVMRALHQQARIQRLRDRAKRLNARAAEQSKAAYASSDMGRLEASVINEVIETNKSRDRSRFIHSATIKRMD